MDGWMDGWMDGNTREASAADVLKGGKENETAGRVRVRASAGTNFEGGIKVCFSLTRHPFSSSPSFSLSSFFPSFFCLSPTLVLPFLSLSFLPFFSFPSFSPFLLPSPYPSSHHLVSSSFPHCFHFQFCLPVAIFEFAILLRLYLSYTLLDSLPLYPFLSPGRKEPSKRKKRKKKSTPRSQKKKETPQKRRPRRTRRTSRLRL